MTLLTRLKRMFFSVFPRSRGDWRWTDTIPLVAFLAVYGVIIWRLTAAETVEPARWILWATGVIAIYWSSVRLHGARHGWPRRWIVWLMGELSWSALLFADRIATIVGWPVPDVVFTQPWQFLWLLAAIWVWWMALNGWSGLNRTRSLQALLIRLTLLGLFVMLLAEPRSVRTKDSVAVVYAIDMSASIHPEQISQAEAFVTRTVAEKPPQDEAGLIVFGSDAAVELPPEKSFPIDANAPEGTLYFNARIDRDATNLEQALSLGAAVLPEDLRGRIVLISDGTETAGNLTPVLNQLRSRGIAVDVLPVTYTYDEEVWIERLELPQMVKLGEPYEASVVISALQDGKAQLILSENGKPIREEPFEIEYHEGKNRIDIPIYLRESGYYEYTARLIPEPGNDGREENNQAVGYIFVEGEGKALVVVDPLRKDDRDFERFVQAVRQSDRAVEIVDSYRFPRDPISLMEYDCIVFANVPRDAFDVTQLDAVHDAVYNQGIGFLMLGGENSFGPGGYHRSVVEDALPVTMDITKKKVLPKGALAIILHTCEFPEGNTWAKRITKQAIKVLGSQDEVGVLAYGAGEEWVFELTPASQYEEMVPKINAAAIGDMPAFGPTMGMGLDALVASDAATKHMIIISDGDPQAPPPTTLNQYVSNKISISTIAIFPHGGQEIGLLRTIANATGGRYYFPSDPNELPSIFIKEAKTLKRSMIQEKEIFPQQGYPSPVLDGISAVPPLQGFVLTSLKEGTLSENVLYTIPEDAEAGETDPVLAIWRYGLGTTAAFTSSLSNQWARDWVDWQQYRAFVNQLMIHVSRVSTAGNLRMWTYSSGGEGIVIVEDFATEEQFLDVVAQVNGPGGMTETVPLKQVGPRRYRGTFPANDKGRFQVTAVAKAGEREDRAYGGFIVSYSPEYLKFTSSYENLREIKNETGGTELTAESTAEDIYNRRQPKRSSQPVFDWFLILLACLIPLDVAIRRVQLDWNVVREWLGLRRTADTTKTMGALLASKQRTSAQLQSRPSERPLPTPLPGRTSEKRAASPKPAAPPDQRDDQVEGDKDRTISRLLDAKRRRHQDDES